jgi:putative endopeptidase
MKRRTIIFSSLAVALSASAFVYHMNNKGVDVASIDKKTKPANDFFQYANGNWIKNNPIPETESRWSAFNIVNERNNDLLKKVLEDAANTPAEPGSAKSKIGAFYRSAMNTEKLNTQKFDALRAYVKLIEGISNKDQLTEIIADMHMMGVGAAFGFEISQDIKNSSEYSPYISQGGLGLPDRDYYLKTDERSQKIVAEYKAHINNMFEMLDYQPRKDFGDAIFAFEARLAQQSMSRTERRDMEKQYNPVSIEALKKMAPSINWDLYFGRIRLNPGLAKHYIVMQPQYIATLNGLFTGDYENWKLYLTWKLLNSTASYLHDDVVNESFRFYGTVLTGTKEQKPRWKRAIAQANGLIGELVAEEYVKEAFTPESKKRVNEMVDNLREAFRMRIAALPWMSTATKVKALEKLNSFTRKLGYPDKWTDLTNLEVTEDYFVNNYFNASRFWFSRNIDKLGKPVDRSEWEMLPQTVNAYYNPVNNEIVFPAAIMQPPFFDPAADDAVNYGAIGAVIGHEFSHGFDDQGSKYDASGNMNDWWSEDDRKLFYTRTKMLVEQFNKFEVLDSVYVNGELTLGENIADLAGLTVAFDAYKRSAEGKPVVNIDGYTPEQRFFIGFGQVWRGHARPEFLRQQVVIDPHSPAKFRVLGTLSNMSEFYQAFGVKKGDPMYREESQRVKIW